MQKGMGLACAIAVTALVSSNAANAADKIKLGSLRRQWDAFFRNFDLLLCPVAASAAFPRDQKTDRPFRQIQVNGRLENYNDQLFWAGLASLAYLPATVAPIGLTTTGLPVGMQIIGPFMQDKTTIEFARLLAVEIGGFRTPPKFA